MMDEKRLIEIEKSIGSQPYSVVLEMIAEIRRLREALAFYADTDNYIGNYPVHESIHFGDRARRALGLEE